MAVFQSLPNPSTLLKAGYNFVIQSLTIPLNEAVPSTRYFPGFIAFLSFSFESFLSGSTEIPIVLTADLKRGSFMKAAELRN